MVQEVAVDGNLCAIDHKRGDGEPIRIDMIGRVSGSPLAKKHDVGHYGGSFALKRIRWEANSTNKIGRTSQVLAYRGVLLVQREMRCHHCQHAAGLQGVDGLGEEVVMERELLSLISELQVGKGDVADGRVDAICGQLRVAETLDADVVARMKGLGNAAGDGVQLDADEARPRLSVSHEIADAAAGFQHGGVSGDAQAGNRAVYGVDDERRGIEGVKRGALGAVVFLGGEQGFQFLADCLPTIVLVAAGGRIGENRESDGPEAGETRKGVFLCRRGFPVVAFDLLEDANSGDDVACLSFFAAGYGNGRRLGGRCREHGSDRADGGWGCAGGSRWRFVRYWRRRIGRSRGRWIKE